MRWTHTLTLALVATVVLAGCGRDTRDLEQWVAQTLQRDPAPLEPIPTVETPEPVTYEAFDLRDPFMRPTRESERTAGESGGSGPRPDPDRRREYLEQFPLDSLAMVGTIQLDEQVYGLVADTEGTIHRVRGGNYIGQNHGRILQVSQGAIQVMELVPDGADGWMEREASLALTDDRPQQR